MLEPLEYLEALVELRKSWIATDPFEYNPNLSHIASASLSHLLPGVPRQRHAELIREVLFHQRWAGLDEQHLFQGESSATMDFLLDSTEVVDPEGALARAAGGEPLIFCTFHHGSYRLVNLLLADTGADFSLVIDQNTLDSQGEKFQRLHETFRSRTGRSTRMEILNAEAGKVGLQAVRRIRKGASLLFYIDGNTGVGGVGRRDDKLVPVSLLGAPLFARKGIAFLSHTTGVPIVPVLCERTGWLSRRMTFHPALRSDGEAEREAFCRETTQALYTLLGEALERAPEQWEGWLYVHRYLDLEALGRAAAARGGGGEKAEAPGEEEVLVLNQERYALLQMGSAPVLFDRLTYRAVPLSGPLHTAISAFHRPSPIALAPGAGSPDHPALVRELFLRRILVRHAAEPEHVLA